MLLTLPFLFAACVQGLLRSDPSLIGRAALGYLPLAVLGISIAAPLTTLLLSASDGLSTLIAGAAGEAPGRGAGQARRRDRRCWRRAAPRSSPS